MAISSTLTNRRSYVTSYQPNTTVLLIGVSLAICGIALTETIMGLLFASVAVACFVLLPGYRRHTLRMLRNVRHLIVISLLTHMLTKAGPALFQLGVFSLSLSGLKTGIIISLRLVLVAVTASLLTARTPPLTLVRSIMHLGLPLKKIGINVIPYSLIAAVGLNFYPILAREGQRIIRSQRARGANVKTGARLGVRELLPVLVPLVRMSMCRAQELAEALEAKGFDVEDESVWGIGTSGAAWSHTDSTVLLWGIVILALGLLT